MQEEEERLIESDSRRVDTVSTLSLYCIDYP